MRKLILLALFAALPVAAQNTDIESLSGLQFNFGNPGARSLGMGGAFLGLADDASAAEANPAGLTILRKPEISVEGRNYQEQQVFSTSGTFPNIDRTAFSHYSQRVDVTFASIVYPIKNFTLGAYYHEPLRNEGAGQVVPVRNDFTGEIKTNVPDFYLPTDGISGPVDRQTCIDLNRQNPTKIACSGYTITPFLSAVDIHEKTFGLAGAWKIGKLSLGGTARYHRFAETAFTFRVNDVFDFDSIAVQATSDIRNQDQKAKDVTDVTFAGGFKFEASDKLSFGGVYKQGAKYKAPTFAANSDTNFAFSKVGDTTFHVPDIYGVGISFRPIPVLTINADAVRVKYSNLTDSFISINEDVRSAGNPFVTKDVTEAHVGAEYFFSTKIPFALRAGYWRDPAHALQYAGPLTSPNRVASAILFPKGENHNHISVGAGLAWPRFQVDVGYDRSSLYRVGSVSAVMRY